jgi:large subunit ribosomal protein L25
MSITVNAVVREDQGKGASRRLRKEEKVPSIVYGGSKAPLMISLNIHEITHLLEDEDTFTSVLDLVVDKSKESVVIKDIQRHPAKKSISHIDFFRIDEKHALILRYNNHRSGIKQREIQRWQLDRYRLYYEVDYIRHFIYILTTITNEHIFGNTI